MHQNSSSQVKNTYPPTKDFRDFGVAEIHKSPEKKTLYTANVYRDLQGLCREIGVQGFQIYGDCIRCREIM